jgi:hypothetical protein
MGVAVFPAAAGGGIKSVQRGLAATAGNVTITSVDISKSFVNIYGTASSGTVAPSGTINALNGTVGATSGNSNALVGNQGVGIGGFGANFNVNAAAFSGNAMNITGGSNNLVAAVVQGYLSNATTLVVSGACRWEVVEFA